MEVGKIGKRKEYVHDVDHKIHTFLGFFSASSVIQRALQVSDCQPEDSSQSSQELFVGDEMFEIIRVTHELQDHESPCKRTSTQSTKAVARASFKDL